MNCSGYRESASAQLDGERAPLPAAVVAAHLGECAGCREWLTGAQRLRRLTTVSPAGPVPDLIEAILSAGPGRGPRRRIGSAAVVRVGLVAVGVAQLLLAVPALMRGADSMSAPMHVAHETGAWNAALAVAFLVVAARPWQAPALLPMVSAFVAILLAMSVYDLADARVGFARLLPHLVMVTGLVLLAALARLHPRARPGASRSTPPVTRVAGLRSVEGARVTGSAPGPAGGAGSVPVTGSLATPGRGRRRAA